MYENAVVIALGSSLGGRFGSPQAAVAAAVEELAEDGFRVLEHSSPWRSTSWPDPTLPDYINAVVIVETPLGPAETLARLQLIERAFGRDRSISAPANAPRVLDLDLIAHGRTVMQEPGLELPHPRGAERRFVMGPLAEIAPDWRHPVLGQNATTLAQKARVGRDARPI
jgi:2-amino-4-hydroxy-6-hydroxymethyldihydropteridine diphosphokinase